MPRFYARPAASLNRPRARAIVEPMRMCWIAAALIAGASCKGGDSSESRTGSGTAPASAAAPGSDAKATPPPARPQGPPVPLAADPGGATGKPRWAKGFGGLGTDYARAVAIGADGAIAVAGYFDGEPTFGALGTRKATPPGEDAKKPTADVFVLGLDKTGAPLWVQTFGGPRDDTANGVAVGKDGTVVAAGNFDDALDIASADGKHHLKAEAAGSDDLFVAAFSKTGAPLWLWTAGGIDSDGADTVVATDDGGWLVGGSFTGEIKLGDTTYTSKGGTDAILVKLTKTGEIQWVQQMGGAYNDSINALATDGRGNIYLMAEFVDSAAFGGAPLPNQGQTGTDIAIAKLDPSGKHVWSKSFGSKDPEASGGIAADPAGNVTVTASFQDELHIEGKTINSLGQFDVMAAHFDTDGNMQWMKAWGSDGSDIAAGVAADAAGNAVLTGWFERSMFVDTKKVVSHGNRDIFVVKLDPKGDVVWLDTFGDQDHDQGRAVALDPDGNPVVAGVYRYKFDAVDPPLQSVREPKDPLPKTDILVLGLSR
jgi:hypothetical protein